ncbi:MAG: hypothetical protein ABSB74_01775 [Tepidisphaeraceae bacterium]
MPTGPRPRWVYVIVAIYLMLLGGLLTMPAWESWLSGAPDMLIPLGLSVSVLVMSGLTLMIVPVRSLHRRPVTRRSVWLPIVGSGLMVGALFFGGSWAFSEFMDETNNIGNQLLIAAGIIWILWSVVFIWITFNVDPAGIGMRLHRWLIAGSVLELLVAVPTHVVVRRRSECCAGIATGLGICIGVAVMFVAFGPSVLLLYYRRRKQITGK